jgi:hypothetical protein
VSLLCKCFRPEIVVLPRAHFRLDAGCPDGCVNR